MKGVFWGGREGEEYLRVLSYGNCNLGWIELESGDDSSLSTRATSFH